MPNLKISTNHSKGECFCGLPLWKFKDMTGVIFIVIALGIWNVIILRKLHLERKKNTVKKGFVYDQFYDAADVFFNKIYPDKELDGLFANLSTELGLDKKSEISCLDENLDIAIDNIDMFLSQKVGHNDLQYSFQQFFILMYFAVQRVEVLTNLLGISRQDKNRYFPVFRKITAWANFIKHPKAFFLCHMPEYYFENDPLFKKEVPENAIIIDDVFLEKYYLNKNNDEELKIMLTNKYDVIVKIPSVVNLSTEFCNSIISFINMIKSNDEYKAILKDTTVIKETDFD